MFFKLNENIIINISSIYSIEIHKSESKEYLIWNNLFNDKIKHIEINADDMSVTLDNITYNINDINNSEDEGYQKIHQIIYDELGPEPEQYTYTYVVILTNGNKVELTKDIYKKLINSLSTEYKDLTDSCDSFCKL